MVSDSKSTAKSFSSSITNASSTAVVETNQDCGIGQTISDRIKVGDINNSSGINIGLNAQQVSDVACVVDASTNVDFKTNIEQAIKGVVKAAATANPTFGVNKADSYVESHQELVTNIVNSIKIGTLQSCMNSQLTSQGVEIGNINNSSKINIQINSSQTATSSCMMKQSAFVSATSDLANQMESDLSATASSGLDFGSLIVLALLFLAFILIGPTQIIGTVVSIIRAIIQGIFDIIKGFFSAIFSVFKSSSNNALPPKYVSTRSIEMAEVK